MTGWNTVGLSSVPGSGGQQFVRKAYMDLKITVHEIDGEAEVADILTKPMPKEPGLYRVFRDILLNNHKVFN